MRGEFAMSNQEFLMAQPHENRPVMIEETGGFIDASGRWVDVQYRGVIGSDKTETTTTLIAGVRSPDSIPSPESAPNMEAHSREVCFLVGLLNEDDHGVLKGLGYDGTAVKEGPITKYSLITPTSNYAGSINKGITLACGTEAAYYALIIAKYCPFDQTKSLDDHRKHWNNWLEVLIDNRTPVSSGRYLVNVLTKKEKADVVDYLSQVAKFFRVTPIYEGGINTG